jgi:ribosomal-protein-alanine N-acetyltransferase
MFFNRPKLSARPATVSDRNVVSTLAHFEQRVHSHLDWRVVEDWLGAQPFLLAEQGQRAVGALACPPDPPDTAWVRLFAVVDNVSTREVWQLLWEQAREILAKLGVTNAAGLSMGDWMGPLYQSAGFQQTHAVVVLTRPAQPLSFSPPSTPARIRLARPEELYRLSDLDRAAFVSPWQLSPAMVAAAMAQADLITVAEVEAQLVGYQLATPSRYGAHLARLAVRPEWQGRGIGTALAMHMIETYAGRGAHELTVNTQDSNTASLRVYRRLGFQLNGTRFPAFQLALG